MTENTRTLVAHANLPFPASWHSQQVCFHIATAWHHATQTTEATHHRVLWRQISPKYFHQLLLQLKKKTPRGTSTSSWKMTWKSKFTLTHKKIEIHAVFLILCIFMSFSKTPPLHGFKFFVYQNKLVVYLHFPWRF